MEFKIVSYKLGPKGKYVDQIVTNCNKTSISKVSGMDTKKEIFPVSVRVRDSVNDPELVTMLRDLAEFIEKEEKREGVIK